MKRDVLTRGFRPFPTLRVEGILASLQHNERVLRLALSGRFGPCDDTQRAVFENAVNALEQVRSLLAETVSATWFSSGAKQHSNGAGSRLTAVQRNVLRLVAEGKNNEEIGAVLHYSTGTIKLHVREILERLGVSDRTQAAVLAVRKGLI